MGRQFRRLAMVGMAIRAMSFDFYIFRNSIESIWNDHATMEIIMGKIRQWFFKWFDRQLEKSLQRQANKLFERRK